MRTPRPRMLALLGVTALVSGAIVGVAPAVVASADDTPVGAGTIVFGLSNGASGPTIGWMTAHGGRPRPVPFDGYAFGFDWSPDGSQLVVSGWRSADEGSGLYLMDADGSNLHRIRNGGAGTWSVSWSPDGRTLAFSADRGGIRGIYLAPVAGGPVRLLTRGSGGGLDWSPDGRKLVLSRENGPGCCRSDLFVVDAADGTTTQLTHGSASDGSPVWAPDGTRVLFSRVWERRSEIWSVSPETREAAVLVPAPTPRDSVAVPRPSPDGSQLIFFERWGRGRVVLANADGSERRVLLDMEGATPTFPGSIYGPTIPAAPLAWQPLPCTTWGTDGDDVLEGTPGRDVVCGLSGDDRLVATAGTDVLVGGPGSDTIDLSRSTSGSVVDLDTGQATTATGAAELFGVENAIGSRFDDELRGDPGVNRLQGNGGMDRLFGGRARRTKECALGYVRLNDHAEDALYGGTGDDLLIGGPRQDRLDGGAGQDRCEHGGDRSSCETGTPSAPPPGPPIVPVDVVPRRNGELIAYSGYFGGAWVIRTDGTEKRQVEPGGRYGTFSDQPSWAPDGSRLALNNIGRNGSVDYTGWAFIQRVRPDGRGLRQITEGNIETWPGWSPQGDVTFECRGTLWTIHPDGTGRRRVVPLSPDSDGVSVSPDGRNVAYVADVGDTSQVFVRDLATGAERQLTDDAGYWMDPAWSPDGTALAATFRNDYGGPGQIWFLSLGTSDRTMFPLPGSEPAWSPDGTMIVFVGEEPDVGIWYANLDGSGLIRVTKSNYDESPAWQPGPVVEP